MRHKDQEWNLQEQGTGSEKNQYSHNTIQTAPLMDIRDELKRLNGLLRCPTFLDIPRQLRRIATNTTKRRRVKLIKRKAA